MRCRTIVGALSASSSGGRPTVASATASSYGVHYGGGATKATGVLQIITQYLNQQCHASVIWPR
jgi:hypothetical protein